MKKLSLLLCEEEVPYITTSKISTPEEAYEFLKEARLPSADREKFYVILLNAKSNVIGYEEASIGGVSKCIALPREVFRCAISKAAVGIVIAHNHPSGCLDPSEEDIKITESLVEAGKIIGISVLDHIIVSLAGYRSLMEEGIM